MDLDVDGLFEDNVCKLVPLGRAIAQLDGTQETIHHLMVELEHVLELMTPPSTSHQPGVGGHAGIRHSQQELATGRIIEALEDARDQGFLPECNLQYAKARLQSALF